MASKRLQVIISGDAKGAQKAFAETSKSAGGMGSSVAKAGKAAALGIAGIGVAAAAVAVKSADKFAQVGGEVIKLTRLTGLSTEQSSRLRAAFQLTGIDAAKSAISLGIFSKNLDSGKLDGFNHSLAGQTATTKKVNTATEQLAKAQAHLSELQHKAKPNLVSIQKATQNVADIQNKLRVLQGTGANAMSKFGFKTRDAKGHLLPMHDTLLKVADVFKKMKDGPEKTALAMQLFGKSGKDMLPFLNKGAAGIAELEKQSDKYGTTLSGKDTDAVKESIKNHRLFTLGMQGLQIQIGRYVLPVIDKLVGFMAEHLPGAMKVVTRALHVLAPAFEAVGRFMTKVVGGVQAFVAAFRAGGDDITSGGFAGKLEQFGLRARAVFDVIVQAVRENFPKVRAAVVSVFGWLIDHKTEILTVLAGVVAGFVAFKVVTTVINLIKALRVVWAALNVVMAANPIALIVIALAALGVAVVLAYQKFKGFRDVVDAVGRWFRDTLWPDIQVVTKGIADAFATLVAWTRKHWDTIKQIVGIAVALVRNIIAVFIGGVEALWRTFGTTITTIAKGAWDAILAIVSNVWTLIRGVVQGAINIVAGIIRFVMAVIHGDWSKAWGALGQVVGGVWTVIKAFVQQGVDGVWIIIQAAGVLIKAIWNGIWSGLAGGVSSAWVSVVTATKHGINAFIHTINAAIRLLDVALDPIGFHINTIGTLDTGGGTKAPNYHGAPNGPPDQYGHIPGSNDHRGPALGPPTKHHTGGTFHAPVAGGVGMALLRDGERVSTPGTSADSGGVVIHVHGSVLSERDLVDVIARAKRRGLIPAGT